MGLVMGFKMGRGVGRNFPRVVVLNAIFHKGYLFTDLFPNTLYRKCIKFAPKKGGSSDPSDPPLPTPLMGTYLCRMTNLKNGPVTCPCR